MVNWIRIGTVTDSSIVNIVNKKDADIIRSAIKSALGIPWYSRTTVGPWDLTLDRLQVTGLDPDCYRAQVTLSSPGKLTRQFYIYAKYKKAKKMGIFDPALSKERKNHILYRALQALARRIELITGPLDEQAIRQYGAA